MGPIQRVNVDFAAPMLEEVDNAAKETLMRQALDQTLAEMKATETVLRNEEEPGT